MEIKRFLKQIGLILLMMLGGTAIDWVIHNLRNEWLVPTEYYRNKILFGAVWGVLGFYALKYWWVVTSPRKMALLVPAVIAGVLQTKYYYQGWDVLSFVLVFLFLHYFMFLPFSWFIFTKYRAVFFEPGLTAMPLVIKHKRLRRILFVLAILLVEILFYLYFVKVEGL